MFDIVIVETEKCTELTGGSARTDRHVERQRRSGALDVLGVDAELVVGAVGQILDGVDGRLRLDAGDARPRRRQVFALLDDVRHGRRAAVRQRRQPRQRQAGPRHVRYFQRSARR